MSNIYIEDYVFVINTIKSIHPFGILGFPNEFSEYAKLLQEKIEDRNSLINALSLITAQLKDGHTNIELPYDENDLCVNIACRWLNDLLYVIEDYMYLEKGDIIESINGMSTAEYLEKLYMYIPHESKYLIKTRTTQYPYQNYHIFSLLNIEKTPIINSSECQIKVNRNGTIVQVYLPIEKYNGCANFMDTTNFIKYQIQDDIAVLILDECRFNDIYKSKLDEFFKEVAINNIKHIILDLSDNMGGQSNVTQEFIGHLNLEAYKFYDMSVRKPNGEIENAVSRNVIIKNEKATKNLYHGKISCLVSNTTFSSARIFATVLKDNEIACIVGEHTGGRPTSYGAPSKFTTPNLNIRFRVSTRIFKRPNSLKDDEESLAPDFYIPKTIKCFDKGRYIAKVISTIR